MTISVAMPSFSAKRFGEKITTLLAIVAILVFSFVPAGSHAPSLHSAERLIADSAHAHDHGDHSHDDDLDLLPEGSQAADHHHADHTHEKLGLVSVVSALLHRGMSPDFSSADTSREDGPPYGIDRPPRFVSLA